MDCLYDPEVAPERFLSLQPSFVPGRLTIRVWAAHFPDGTHVPTKALIVPQTLLILLSNAYRSYAYGL